MSKINKKKIKKKRGFSEKLILLVVLWSISVFERGLYFSFKYITDSIWMYIIPAVGTILGSTIGFHIWKTKNENVTKISNNPNYDENQLKEQMKEQLKQEVLNEFSNLGRNY